MNKEMTISVTCKDDATKERYMALAAKMEADTEFKSGLNMCKSDKDVYDLYSKHGYTDMDFETFKVEFKNIIDGVVNIHQEGNVKLSEDDLDNVVGGFDAFKFFTGTFNVLPILGPLISGTAKAIKAGIDGQGAAGVIKNLGVGLGVAMVDAVTVIGTAGLGAGVSMGVKAGIMVGESAIKSGLNEALE